MTDVVNDGEDAASAASSPSTLWFDEIWQDEPKVVCYHEAAHAAFADRLGLPVDRVWAGTPPEGEEERGLLGCCISARPAVGWEETGPHLAALSMVGPYAAWRLTKGGAAPLVPFAEFVGRFGEEAEAVLDDRDRTDAPDGRGNPILVRDEVKALVILQLSGRGDEEGYEGVCREVARWVEDAWPEIEAVAERLAERGCLGGVEVHNLIRDARGSEEYPGGRPYALLDDWRALLLRLEDRDEVQEWKEPGGWLHELTDEAAPWTKGEGEEEPL
jgi:hypothetical protein